MRVIVKEDDKVKVVRSHKYNFNFDKTTGVFQRWGSTKEEDPNLAPAPEILDLEISYGPCSQACAFCYKANGSGPSVNMTFDTFVSIFNKITKKKLLTQIAFGITDIYSNPDFFHMMEFSREHGVIPNYTTSGFDLDDNAVKETVRLCGATAVSIHDKEVAFNAIQKLTTAGMKQVNVHHVLMDEYYSDTFDLIDELTTDSRTKNLNALVLLAYKPKGRNAGKFHSVTDIDKYRKLMEYAKSKSLNLGFDSCSAPIVFKSFDINQFDYISNVGEPCESTLFSSYINADGEFFPCSFTEGEVGWESGIPVNDYDDFDSVWHHPRVEEFRLKLIPSSANCNCIYSKHCRNCPTFSVTNCHKEF